MSKELDNVMSEEKAKQYEVVFGVSQVSKELSNEQLKLVAKEMETLQKRVRSDFETMLHKNGMMLESGIIKPEQHIAKYEAMVPKIVVKIGTVQYEADVLSDVLNLVNDSIHQIIKISQTETELKKTADNLVEQGFLETVKDESGSFYITTSDFHSELFERCENWKEKRITLGNKEYDITQIRKLFELVSDFAIKEWTSRPVSILADTINKLTNQGFFNHIKTEQGSYFYIPTDIFDILWDSERL